MSSTTRQLRAKLRDQRERLMRILSSRPAGAVAACLSALVVLGCMGIAIGNRTAEEMKSCSSPGPSAEDNGPLTQEGKIHIRPGSEKLVYYPIPYSSPPNLELADDLDYCDVIEEKENCFRVRFHTGFSTSQQTLCWKARGVRCAPPPAPPAAQPSDATPPTETAPAPSLLPPAPEPVK